jgi:hypothetical protein
MGCCCSLAPNLCCNICSYEPGPAFEEVKHEAMLDLSPTVSKEFWLIQWIKDKDVSFFFHPSSLFSLFNLPHIIEIQFEVSYMQFDVSKFHGKELSLKLHQDGNLGSLESSSGMVTDV